MASKTNPTIERLRSDLEKALAALSSERLRASRAAESEAACTRQVAAKATEIAQRDERLRQKDEQIAALAGERDRIMRVVDQFTSVEIRAFTAPGNSPKELRKP